MRRLATRAILTTVFSATLTVTVQPVLVSAADPKRIAITDPAQVDIDFTYQGEYAGAINHPNDGSRHVGLQVIARGDGKFESVLCEGGLPGAGWDETTKTPLSGMLGDGNVTLVTDGLMILVDGRKATVQDTSGAILGELPKLVRVSPTLGASAPPQAIVLFDGGSTENLEGANVTDDGLLEVGTTTKIPVRDFRLHLEFRLPYMPYATGQGRANSGVYIQRRYEVQILDSFGLEGIYNECGALYRQQPPDVNMCLPPLSWQTYDIWFRAARFGEDGEKTENARITVLHNGVPIHSNREIVAKTGAGLQESPEPMPILLQDHGNPVNFRNIWIVLGEPTLVEAEVAAAPKRCVCRPRHTCPIVQRIVSCLRRCR